MPELAPTLPLVVAVTVLVALNAYVLMGGADFGGGVWDLLGTGPRRARQRALIAEAIGPIWEANHVWLILAVVLLFTCFPAVFARLSVRLHIPLTLMLIGIVLRGSAFTFRSYDSQRDDVQQRWGRIFAVGSVLTPILLGVSVGAVAAGNVGPLELESFLEGYVWPWLQPFPFAVGLLTTVLFAFLAAVYLTLETKEEALRDDFRRRALAAGAFAFPVAGLTLLLARADAPRVWQGLFGSPWALELHLATAIAAITALAALWRRRFQLARVAAAAQVSFILWGWGLAQYPYMVPPDLTIEGAAAPPITLRLVLVGLAFGTVVLVPSLYYLFVVFRRKD